MDNEKEHKSHWPGGCGWKRKREHPQTMINNVDWLEHWPELAGVMAQHMDWTVERCKRSLTHHPEQPLKLRTV